MRQKKLSNLESSFFVSLMLIFSLFGSENSGFCKSVVDDHGPVMTYLDEKIRQNWEPLSFKAPMVAKVQFILNKEGRVSDVKLLQSSGNLQSDGSCLESIFDLDPISPLSTFGLRETTETVVYTFNNPDTTKNFHCEDKVQLKANQLVVHNIPLSVSWRYPGVLVSNVLHQKKELQIIDSINSDSYKNWRNRWADFFEKHLVVKQSEVEKYSELHQVEKAPTEAPTGISRPR